MPDPVLTSPDILERIRRDGVRRTATALRKPPVPSRLLQELADQPETPFAQQFVAAYPLSPSHLLETLARTAQDPEVFPFLATNPRTPPHLLSEFAAHENPEVRAYVATHPQLAARELLVLAEDTDVAVRRAVATNPSLRLPHHAALTADTNPGVRLRLAAQSGLPAQVTLALATDPSTIVRTHTVATAPADDDLLLGWAASDEEDLQLALASRPELPAPVQRLLLLSSSPNVRRAARALVTPDPVELFHFVTHGDAEERAWVAAIHPLPSALQRLLAQDEAPAVHAALAANPSLDEEIASYFIALADDNVCVALATNPTVTPDQVQALAGTRKPAVLTALAYRESIDSELALFLLEHSPDFLRHWSIQRRALTIADAAFARRLATHLLPTVRALGIANHPWRRADLYEFARDPALPVRLAVLRHAHVPDDVLAAALTDLTPEIAAAAQAAHAARELAARAALTAKPTQPVVSVKTISDPAAAPRTAARPSTAQPAEAAPAPKLFNQLKRLFWQ